MKSFTITQSITPREEQNIEKYFIEIDKIDLLTPEEEVELAKRIRNKDAQALEKMIKANLRFVVSVAKKYAGEGKKRKLSLNDLINFGNIGLIKAAERFDETRGFKFISYAIWWVRQSILKEMYDLGKVIRLPMTMRTLPGKISVAENKLLQNGFPPESIDDAMIADMIGVATEQVTTYRRLGGSQMSLDAPIPGSDSDEGWLSIDTVVNESSSQPDAELMQDSDRLNISRVLAILSPGDRTLLEDYYGLDGRFARSMETLAEERNTTVQTIRNRVEKAKKKLRKGVSGKVLRSCYQGK